MPEVLPDWPGAMSEKVAAAYISVSASTLRELRAQGEIRRVKIGKRRYVYRRKDLDRFLDRLAPTDEPEEVSEWDEA